MVHTQKLNSDELKKLEFASCDFVYFVNEIFSQSSKTFIYGKYLNDTAIFLSKNDKTIRICARGYFKSYAFYAYYLWNIMFGNNNRKIHFISFNSEIAKYHIDRIKSLIKENQYFRNIGNLNIVSYGLEESELYNIDDNDIVLIDDIFQDPDNGLDSESINTINETIKTKILNILKLKNCIIHIVGTPVSSSNFCFDKNITKYFKVKTFSAITKKNKALWKEWMSIEELESKKDETNNFEQEYLCKHYSKD